MGCCVGRSNPGGFRAPRRWGTHCSRRSRGLDRGTKRSSCPGAPTGLRRRRSGVRARRGAPTDRARAKGVETRAAFDPPRRRAASRPRREATRARTRRRPDRTRPSRRARSAHVVPCSCPRRRPFATPSRRLVLRRQRPHLPRRVRRTRDDSRNSTAHDADDSPRRVCRIVVRKEHDGNLDVRS